MIYPQKMHPSVSLRNSGRGQSPVHAWHVGTGHFLIHIPALDVSTARNQFQNAEKIWMDKFSTLRSDMPIETNSPP